MNNIYQYLNTLKKEDAEKYNYLITWEKEMIVSLLIDFLNENMNCKYLYSIIDDISGNSADAIVLEESGLFSKELEGHDLLRHDVEDLIDDRFSDNSGEIIILDLNGASKNINLSYLFETIEAEHISYSNEIKKYIETFLNFLINKRLQA